MSKKDTHISQQPGVELELKTRHTSIFECFLDRGPWARNLRVPIPNLLLPPIHSERGRISLANSAHRAAHDQMLQDSH
jgi:hypothetical protein